MWPCGQFRFKVCWCEDNGMFGLCPQQNKFWPCPGSLASVWFESKIQLGKNTQTTAHNFLLKNWAKLRRPNCFPDFVWPKFGLIMNHAILFVPVLAWTYFWLGLLGPQTKPALTSSKGQEMRYPPQFSLNVFCSYYLVQRGLDKVCMSTWMILNWAGHFPYPCTCQKVYIYFRMTFKKFRCPSATLTDKVLMQDNYLEEAMKMRNLLEEFRNVHGNHGIRKPTILGVREHVFTGRLLFN